jgi:Zn-dependent protease
MSALLGEAVGAIPLVVLQVPALLVAVTVHELAHGLTAWRLGDPTARLQGRVTLNPLRYLDPLGVIAFFVSGVTWSRPVPVNPYNLGHPRRDAGLIGVSALLVNGALAIALGVALAAAPGLWLRAPALATAIDETARASLRLALVNLVPIPPLDAGHFLPYLFPGRAWPRLHRVEALGSLVLLLLCAAGAARYTLEPVAMALAPLGTR